MTDVALETTELRSPSWIDLFAGVLVAPLQTMHVISTVGENSSAGLAGAAMAVIIPFGLDGLRMIMPPNFWVGMLSVPGSIIVGLTMWLSLAGLLALLGWSFGAPAAQCRRALVLTGWSFLPWIFMAPLFCYKGFLGDSFKLFASIPMTWIFILQVAAIREAFQLRAMQLLLLVFVAPGLYYLFQFLQIMQSFYVALIQ